MFDTNEGRVTSHVATNGRIIIYKHENLGDSSSHHSDWVLNPEIGRQEHGQAQAAIYVGNMPNTAGSHITPL